jgi:hypothetical protein
VKSLFVDSEVYMRSKVIIVDNFYTKPEKVRERALVSDYADIASTDYPGFASRLRLETETLQNLFGCLVGSELNVDKARFTWGGFRFITEESGKHAKVHADVAVDWAGMVYLTPNAPMNAGTAFFRHKETGFQSPPTNREARALGFSDASEFDDKVIRQDKADLSKWEQTVCIEPVYNRLILFRGGDFYHAPIGGYGNSPESARLTHVFFFNEMLDTSILKCHVSMA